jgi:hypothetical protein
MELTRMLEIQETERIDDLQSRPPVPEPDLGQDVLALTETSIAPNEIIPLPGSQPNPSSLSLRPPVATTSRSQSVPADSTIPTLIPRKPVWQAHDIDIDTLHYKLIRHKYHTPADFLHDVSLIEENSHRLADAERGVKIAEMGANARIHVAGFDERWTPEFERYKIRMDERREKKRLEKGKGKEVDDQGGEGSAGVKRVREGEDGEEDERVEKRLKGDEMEVDIPDVTISNPAPTSQITVPPPRSPPPPVYPPFILPEATVQQFKMELETGTVDLNVEELEQLRAGLYERVWEGRAEWDRRGVVEIMRTWVQEFLRDCHERKEKDDA